MSSILGSVVNSHANGIVERLHFDVRQALFKAADGDQSCWSQVAYSVFWSEHITPCKCMGFLPFFAAMSVQPLLPFDIIEANYLLPPLDSILSLTNLVARCAVALQKQLLDLMHLCVKVHNAHNCAAI